MLHASVRPVCPTVTRILRDQNAQVGHVDLIGCVRCSSNTEWNEKIVFFSWLYSFSSQDETRDCNSSILGKEEIHLRDVKVQIISCPSNIIPKEHPISTTVPE